MKTPFKKDHTHSMFGDMAVLDKYLLRMDLSESDRDKAKRVQKKILGNYKMTKTDLKYIKEIAYIVYN